MDDDMKTAVDVAVIKTEINGLREQHKAHSETMFKKLDDHAKEAKEATAAVMQVVTPISEWIQKNHEVPGRVGVLWDNRNEQKGFLKASSMIGGGMAGLAVMIAEKLFR